MTATKATISAGTLRARLGEILDRASAGERIVIERDHRPLALLVPFEDGARLEPDENARTVRNLAALDRLDALAERLSREHAWPNDAPDALTALRQDRGRDDV